ncbi:MAG: hypothetical protein IKT00_11105 [Prevotella sp.]|nr:hypothetical protein [Prevotella sp.]
MARNDSRMVRNILRRPRWWFLRRRMPFRTAVHGFYAVDTHSAPPSAPSTSLTLTPETRVALSTPLTPAPEIPAIILTARKHKAAHPMWVPCLI